MATYDLPAALYPQMASLCIRKSGVQFRGAFNGNLQAIDLAGERWVVSMTTPPKRSSAAGAVEAFCSLIAGGVNKVRMHHPQRYEPLGTLRGTPTVQVATVRGDSSIVLTVASGATLKAGDMIGVTGHLLQVAQDCSAVSTTLTVPLVNRLRGVIAMGSAVTWDKPKTLFICASMANMVVHRPGYIEGATLDFEEAWD